MGRSASVAILAWLTLAAFDAAFAQTVGPPRGALVIAGGGVRDRAIWERFQQLAGGADAPVVVIPTAGGAKSYGSDWDGLERLREAGFSNLTLLHTYDRAVADTDEFVKPIREARGVWFTGGRQWRLADSYLDTKTHRELWKLLDRGGVIGGSSAGATIQGSYLVRGDTKKNTIMMGDHERGLGFLKDVCIDQHLLRRNRHFDLIEVVSAHPELLGVGIDEDTAIVVEGDVLEVVGRSYAVIYDPAQVGGPRPFYFLAPGERFNLATRKKIERRGALKQVEIGSGG